MICRAFDKEDNRMQNPPASIAKVGNSALSIIRRKEVLMNHFIWSLVGLFGAAILIGLGIFFFWWGKREKARKYLLANTGICSASTYFLPICDVLSEVFTVPLLVQEIRDLNKGERITWESIYDQISEWRKYLQTNFHPSRRTKRQKDIILALLKFEDSMKWVNSYSPKDCEDAYYWLLEGLGLSEEAENFNDLDNSTFALPTSS